MEATAPPSRSTVWSRIPGWAKFGAPALVLIGYLAWLFAGNAQPIEKGLPIPDSAARVQCYALPGKPAGCLQPGNPQLVRAVTSGQPCGTGRHWLLVEPPAAVPPGIEYECWPPPATAPTE